MNNLSGVFDILRTIIYRIGWIVLLVTCCENPFATREVEEPIRARSNREIPSDPEAVLQNLKSAIADKNVANYMACLTSKAQSFSFVPDQFVKENNPVVFQIWGLEEEQNYMNQVRNYVPIDSISQLSLDEIPGTISNEVFADSALLRRNYTLILNHTYKGNVPRRATGQAYFWIFKEEGQWFIRRWIDFGTSGQACWSAIKAGFGQ